MSDRRCRATAQTLAALSAAALLVPTTPALARTDWIAQDLASADRVGLVLDDGALRVATGGSAGGTSARREHDAPETGLATFPDLGLGARTDTVDLSVRAEGDRSDVLAEARGVRDDGMWTEWHPAPRHGRVTLPESVSRVQLRVEVDGDGTALTGLGVRAADPSPHGGPGGGRWGRDPWTGGPEYPDPTGGQEGAAGERTRPFSARLFATRIGLVGGRTANGHTIRTADHFVALPSRRALAPRGGGDYTVRVCTTGALGPKALGAPADHEPRCAYLPVWDVGPWNITDDHWNESRQSWPDLDHGRPQAQAAYSDGHNGGRDGFGRRVRNPAGIDLADGAFREGLQLPDNGWVEVDYLWTADYRAKARITTATRHDPVVVRGGPGLEHSPVGLAAHTAVVDVACQAVGDVARGPFGTDDAWYRIGEGNYVPAVFADGGADAPACEPLP
ncbi:hypothetical protein BJF83_12925 [Nocardiopsis sp. CNR-923]|uniref:hypothetical protein n=1 Tax=Nocardiopsis sp. CNR-923 TaxID=1904965 RepID=UPI00095DFE28|nr:hypothetical protein [Nocardiopsis sp. CNR-923]OLT29015.1 hypothetical protein BJF83_12925 [Nocardiopsis sp. CNR-923]